MKITPAFLLTLDTEGDNLWARPRTVTTRNAGFLKRFQALAERHGLRPTWLVNWEMARDPVCVEFLRDVLARNAGEIGMHLHAWDTPPLEPLTADDTRHHPFLTEFPEAHMRSKIERLVALLTETFGRPPRTHRAGRWAFNGVYARLLREHGFEADCSVCPGVNWSTTPGSPAGKGGSDFRKAPVAPYYINEADVCAPAGAAQRSTLLEVPMTIGARRRGLVGWFNRFFNKRHDWLRPNGRNIKAMCSLVDDAVADGRAHLMFMLHSSELMPGGSPTFCDALSIERLYADLDLLFVQARQRGCTGATLGEFAAAWRTRETAKV